MDFNSGEQFHTSDDNQARLRVDEAKRLASEMEGRNRLLEELERELQSLEGERDDALLALQETRATLDAKEREKDELKAEILSVIDDRKNGVVLEEHANPNAYKQVLTLTAV